jgi:phosphoenolpyruvate carboxylase
MLRSAKLTVDDEIENALSYYRATFLAQIPELYREIEEALPGSRSRPSSAWATGSAATATATVRRRGDARHRARAQSETALRHYLTEVHELGAELSNSATLSTCRRRCRRSPTRRATPARTAPTSRTGAP